MVILQKIGKATPSIAATLIERLPDEDDPKRSTEKKIAQNVAALSYVGPWSRRKWTLKHDSLTVYVPSISRR